MSINSCINCNSTIQNNKKFCNSSCAAKFNNKNRKRSTESRQKTSQKLKEFYVKNPIEKQTIFKHCCVCNIEFIYKHDGRTTCSKQCSSTRRKIAGAKGGRVTSSLSFGTRSRSKNERYFSTLLSDHFNNILTNKRMFGEYDADIILEDLKIAIHWNGPFHFLPIFGSEHLNHIQTRDELRYSSIVLCGYTNYIINDQDNKGFSKLKCEEELQKLLLWINNGTPGENRTLIGALSTTYPL